MYSVAGMKNGALQRRFFAVAGSLFFDWSCGRSRFGRSRGSYCGGRRGRSGWRTGYGWSGGWWIHERTGISASWRFGSRLGFFAGGFGRLEEMRSRFFAGEAELIVSHFVGMRRFSRCFCCLSFGFVAQGRELGE
jgi:hypothetical protein